MKLVKYLLLTNVFLFTMLYTGYGQSRKSLEKKIKYHERKIRLTTRLLKQTRKKKEVTYNQYLLLDKEVKTRSELLQSLKKEIEFLNDKITENQDLVSCLNDDLTQLRQQYAKLIYFAWKYHSPYQQIMFVLAADDFNQAFMRMKYIQQLTDYRKRQVEAIAAIMAVLNTKVQALQDKRLQKQQVLGKISNEKQLLAQAKQQQQQTLEKLKKKEASLRSQYKKERAAANRLKKRIAALIAAEARRSKHNKKATKKSGTYMLTPAEKLISSKFQANKGHLPWPTIRGVITEHFGRHEHKLMKGVIVNNDGVYISTTANSKVRAIFKGEVRQIFEVPGKHYVVLIKHGLFITVYTGLKSVSVKVGTKVSAKQTIGIAYTDSDTKKTIVELQIWKGTQKVNPELWLAH